ncbi:alcohol dehydrogenase catalytic domain-containing protein [Salsipaludibacter albus]|uniref:alcohol dehydrogenase catalytic domain-containing protein n=1 Tax=Salsipaludibacter albus TaxID=2849650 RepID=UPI001EE4D2CB|nr:zinc-binding dehydrogenase [Salsipaludibacter albus]MBY5163345.1 zinc-binding dehydrogenase [Salsipaludibacter albus]
MPQPLPDTMRAARLHATASDPERGPSAADVRIDELAVPEPGPGEVLVAVAACGVCASDLHVALGITPAATLPLTLGHEAAGTIAAVGDDVGDWQVGDRVLVPAGRSCGTCALCRTGRDNLCQEVAVLGVDVDGAQAGWVRVPARLPLPVPGHVDLVEAAILADAVATPYHALKRGGIGDGMVAVVIGLGGLGMHALQLARLAGAEVIGIDVDEVALQRAREWGAVEVVDASRPDAGAHVRSLTGGGADVSFEFVGSADTAALASSVLAPGGRATLAGIGRDRLAGPPLGLFVSREQEVVGSFGATTSDVNELLDLLDAGRLDLSRSISHRLDIDDFPTALEMLHTRHDHPLRIVITH